MAASASGESLPEPPEPPDPPDSLSSLDLFATHDLSFLFPSSLLVGSDLDLKIVPSVFTVCLSPIFTTSTLLPVVLSLGLAVVQQAPPPTAVDHQDPSSTAVSLQQEERDAYLPLLMPSLILHTLSQVMTNSRFAIWLSSWFIRDMIFKSLDPGFSLLSMGLVLSFSVFGFVPPSGLFLVFVRHLPAVCRFANVSRMLPQYEDGSFPGYLVLLLPQYEAHLPQYEDVIYSSMEILLLGCRLLIQLWCSFSSMELLLSWFGWSILSFQVGFVEISMSLHFKGLAIRSFVVYASLAGFKIDNLALDVVSITSIRSHSVFFVALGIISLPRTYFAEIRRLLDGLCCLRIMIALILCLSILHLSFVMEAMLALVVQQLSPFVNNFSFLGE